MKPRQLLQTFYNFKTRRNCVGSPITKKLKCASYVGKLSEIREICRVILNKKFLVKDSRREDCEERRGWNGVWKSDGVDLN